MNRILVIPTLLTLGNGVCGFAAIAYLSKIGLHGTMPSESIDLYFLLGRGADPDGHDVRHARRLRGPAGALHQ